MALITILLLATPTFATEIKESDVKGLLDNWLTAQNTSAYASYAGLYATKFQGIKRSGDRTSRFNHDSWLKDRKRMFKNKMNVTAASIQIQVLETGVIVKFEQTWESNGYKDKGDKQLYLILENDHLRIAREEMLASKVLVGKGMVLDSTNFPFAYVMKEGIVISDTEVKIDLKKLRFDSSNGVDHVATIPVDAAVLSEATRSLLGMPVRIYDTKGTCETTINGFMMVSKKIPHFGEIQRWKEEKTPRKEIAFNIYKEGLKHLVATTEKCSGDFAKRANMPESPIFVGKEADQESTSLAKKTIKLLPAYKTNIKPYLKDSYAESIRMFDINLSGKSERWISMVAAAGQENCGGEGGSIAVLWKIDDSSKGKSLKFVQYLDNDLEYATDVDNDGIPEFLSRDPETRGVPHTFDIIRTNGSKKQDFHFKGSYDYDCPC